MTDDSGGSGVSHVTLYVAADGGDFEIWQRQLPDASGSDVFQGEAGKTYEFLALATDVAGNRELPPPSVVAADDGSSVNLGAVPTVAETTPPNFGIPPQASSDPSTNSLFAEAELGIPAAGPVSNPSEFAQILQPFHASAFATGIPSSHAGVGPMGIVEMPDGSIVISGGTGRNQLFRLDSTGGSVGQPMAELGYPVFNLAYDPVFGSLWATTGGGPLLQLDPNTGAIVEEYGDGLTIALAVEPGTGMIYVSSGLGVEIFDPVSGTFEHYSRDENLRVGALAFAADGTLWAATWPDRTSVVRFNDRARAEVMLELNQPVDSIAFGQSGTPLENLLFVSHNAGSTVASRPESSQLTMVDLVTMRSVAVADGGTRGDVVITTSDGRILISQSNQVDLLDAAATPQVVATNPPTDALAALPLGLITVDFDTDMLVADAGNPASVINPDNYVLVGDGSGPVPIRSASYDPASRTMLLLVDSLGADRYELTVRGSIQSVQNVPLGTDFTTQFTAVSDFSSLVDVVFTKSRSDRDTGTVSYDVTVTNIGGHDLLLPVVLVLDPRFDYEGVPVDAVGQTTDGRWLVDLSANLPGGLTLAPNQSTDGKTVTVANPDHRRVDFDSGVSALATDNLAPIFDTTPVTTAAVGQPYTYQASAHDPDGVGLAYILYRGPAGMTVDAATGLVSWLPTGDSPADAAVILDVYDTRGGRASQDFTVAVAGGNHSPQFAPVASTIYGAEGTQLSIVATATDDDGDPLFYWAENLPPFATLNSATGVLSWMPGYESAGTYNGVTIIASDGASQTSIGFNLLIAPTDRPPILTPPAARTLREGDRLRFYLDGGDPDGEQVAFTSTALPDGAFLDLNTGLFDWTVAFDQAGLWQVPFTVTSGGVSVTKTAEFDVLNANAAPVFDPLEGWRVVEGGQIAFRAIAVDPDNPGYVPPDRLPDGSLTQPVGTATVSYQVTGLPPGAAFDPDTLVFSWTPGFSDAGTYDVTFTATDDGDGTGQPLVSSITVPIEVLNLNRRPVIAAGGKRGAPAWGDCRRTDYRDRRRRQPDRAGGDQRPGRFCTPRLCHADRQRRRHRDPATRTGLRRSGQLSDHDSRHRRRGRRRRSHGAR